LDCWGAAYVVMVDKPNAVDSTAAITRMLVDVFLFIAFSTSCPYIYFTYYKVAKVTTSGYLSNEKLHISLR